MNNKPTIKDVNKIMNNAIDSEKLDIKPTMEDWKKVLLDGFKHAELIVVNKDRCGGEPTIGESRFRFSELTDFIKDLLARQSEEWQGETLDERCDWHKDVEGGFHCQYCCPICNPELKNTGGKE